jgi:hypothetical protein
MEPGTTSRILRILPVFFAIVTEAAASSANLDHDSN